MNCPNCNTRLACLESRAWGDDTQQRRYKCASCKSQHYTQETFGKRLHKPKVIKPVHVPKPKLKGKRGTMFDADTVLHLRELYKNGYSTKYLSTIYNCHQATVQDAIFGRGAYK